MVVGVNEQLKMPSKFIMAGIVVTFDGGVFDGPVHPLDLTIGPRMVGLGQPVFDPMLGADAIEQMTCEPCCWPIAIARWMAELDSVVGQDGVQSVRAEVDEQTLRGSVCPPKRRSGRAGTGRRSCGWPWAPAWRRRAWRFDRYRQTGGACLPACSRIAAKVRPACRIIGASLLQTGPSSVRTSAQSFSMGRCGRRGWLRDWSEQPAEPIT